ncbi:MAG TPA: hypothetical protein VN179_04895 [Solirubrobacterales bacterium]|nr:hypothetical protein [Solirubrobacterales bacterium]
MLPAGSIISDVATGFGLAAVMIAVCGFIGQVPAALRREDDQTVRAVTVIGGLVGLALASLVVLVDSLW